MPRKRTVQVTAIGHIVEVYAPSRCVYLNAAQARELAMVLQLAAEDAELRPAFSGPGPRTPTYVVSG